MAWKIEIGYITGAGLNLDNIDLSGVISDPPSKSDIIHALGRALMSVEENYDKLKGLPPINQIRVTMYKG